MDPLSKIVNAVYVKMDDSVYMIPLNPRSKSDIRRRLNSLINALQYDEMHISSNGGLYKLSGTNHAFCSNICVDNIQCLMDGGKFWKCGKISNILRKFDKCLFKSGGLGPEPYESLVDRDLALCHLGIRTKHWTFLKRFKKDMVATKIIRTGKKKRVIHIAKPQLAKAQRRISNKLLDEYEAPPCVHGFVKGRGIASNADLHVNKPVVIHFDVKDFFPSIKEDQVKQALGLIYPSSVIDAILPLVLWKGRLPIGFATSPILSNLVFDHYDTVLSEVANNTGLVYSRYADNMVFSGDVDWTTAGSMVDIVSKSIKPFKLNKKKTKIMRSGKRQYVTGVVVNEKRNLPVEYYKKLRACVHQWNNHDEDKRRQVLGMLAYAKQINPQKHDKLRTQLCKTVCDNRDRCPGRFSSLCLQKTITISHVGVEDLEL